MNFTQRFAHDGLFWRRLAQLGASRGPDWLRRYSPPFFGCAVALAVPAARRAVSANLRRVRGEVSPLVNAIDIAKTFSQYAYCLTDGLARGERRDAPPETTFCGEHFISDALAAQNGAIFATAHTGGWELVGPLLLRDRNLELVMVMERERDDRARRLQDEARSSDGVRVVHVDSADPLAALPLLHHVRRRGVVAIQVDRTPPGMKTRAVSLFGSPAALPDGPFRIAQLSGAPILPLFATRTGDRAYLIHAYPKVTVSRHATEADLNAAAQSVADALTDFIRAHPTDWFNFRDT